MLLIVQNIAPVRASLGWAISTLTLKYEFGAAPEPAPPRWMSRSIGVRNQPRRRPPAPSETNRWPMSTWMWFMPR